MKENGSSGRDRTLQDVMEGRTWFLFQEWRQEMNVLLLPPQTQAATKIDHVEQ